MLLPRDMPPAAIQPSRGIGQIIACRTNPGALFLSVGDSMAKASPADGSASTALAFVKRIGIDGR
ncbi:hypothetical protein [Sphingomonas sp.]|uniref:hypothetical protein n=1 Tax=Sphingomonas sp. TaxID=28214 RepID=UPI003D6CBBE1